MTTTTDPAFGRRLKEARLKARLTLDDVNFEMRLRLHRRWRITQGTLSRWETGQLPESDADPITVGWLAKLYGVDVRQLSEVAADALDEVAGVLDLRDNTSERGGSELRYTHLIPGQRCLPFPADTDLLHGAGFVPAARKRQYRIAGTVRDSMRPRRNLETHCDRCGQRRRDAVADLRLDRCTSTDELEVVGKREQPLELWYPQSAVLPVERTDVWAGLGLDRRGRAARVELQQEGPIAATPVEDRVGVAALSGEVQIVVAGRDLGQEVLPLAADHLLWLEGGLEPRKRLADGDVRPLDIPGGPALPFAAVRRLGKRRRRQTLAGADDEEPRPQLRNAVVSGVEHG